MRFVLLFNYNPANKIRKVNTIVNYNRQKIDDSNKKEKKTMSKYSNAKYENKQLFGC